MQVTKSFLYKTLNSDENGYAKFTVAVQSHKTLWLSQELLYATDAINLVKQINETKEFDVSLFEKLSDRYSA